MKKLEQFEQESYVAQDMFYGVHLSNYVQKVAQQSITERHQFINGAFIHQWKVASTDPERLQLGYHLFVRRIANLWAEYERRAEQLGYGPWDEKDRIIIDCRNFALLDASLLRFTGVPARIRNGFSSYIADGYLQDHWICERWDGKQWIADDPDLQKQNVSQNEFIPGTQAWLLARQDITFADQCGYGMQVNDRGLWAVQLSAVRDLNALHGFVCVSGDGWGLGNKKTEELTADDLLLLDTLCSQAQPATQKSLPQGISMPAKIGNYDYIKNHWQEVDWEKEP